MKRFIINCSIDQEIVEKFIKCVDESADEPVAIYLTSNGGSEAASYIMLDIINRNPEKFELYALEKIYSAAFELFFMARCNRAIAPYTVGMTHIAGSEMRIDMTGNPVYDCDKATLIAGKRRVNDLDIFLSGIGVTAKDRKKVLRGEDLYFQFDRLEEMLNYQLSS
jgi:hypothetical protein